MEFEKNEIILFSKLSELSYFTQEEINEIYYTRPCLEQNFFIYLLEKTPKVYVTFTNCQYITSETKDYLIISYKGTNSKKDILSDLNFFKQKIFFENYIDFRNQPYVHSGFLYQFKSSQIEVTNTIKNYTLLNKNKSIIFTGHSLGGALATIGSIFYSFKLWDYPVSCVTFGSPRVGCYTFAKIFNKRINKSLRFVKDNDPIPCVPDAWNFKHVNSCKWLNKNKIMSEINVYREWGFIKNSFLNLIGYGYNPSRDHSCEKYTFDLEKIL